jgi:hypothetical protein
MFHVEHHAAASVLANNIAINLGRFKQIASERFPAMDLF